MIKKIIITLLVLILISIIIFIYYQKSNSNKVIENITNYNYELKVKNSSIYTKYYKELKNILKSDNVNYDEYKRVISKMFVIDFYSLNNKQNKKDIGGIEFIHPSIKENFTLKASNTIYKYLEYDNNRKQDLPEVIDAKIKEEKEEKFNYLNQKNEISYLIILSLDYKKDIGYSKEVTLRLIKDDNKFYIVEIN